MLGVNLRGPIVLVRECVRQMLVRPGGGERSGAGASSVLVVSSVVASRRSPRLAVYADTKAGVDGFAKSLARELGPRGIIVGAVDFLTGPRAAFITGQTLTIDGGSAG